MTRDALRERREQRQPPLSQAGRAATAESADAVRQA
jgi:hypothetical protein